MLLILILELLLEQTQLASAILNVKSELPIVAIKNGRVQGAKFKVEGGDFTYYGFQGIPYAEPPVGERRFLPPHPKSSWPGVLNATKDITACIQPMGKEYAINTSEDCLVLNVYTPNLKGSLPVMVYIYGGAFLAGSASKRIYGPDYLIQENVVLVVPNYRLGIFGFLSTMDEAAPGNNGLKDQIMALEWVKENIAAFGGNPDSVTIFGESAGSASVSLLLQAKSAEGLFHGAIMESGVSLSLFSRTRKPLKTAKSTAKLLNIDASTNEELVQKLRGVNAEKLLQASLITIAEVTIFGNPLNGLYFSPTIEPPHEYSHESLKKGHFNKVPVIVGFNSAEGNPFEAVLIELPLYLTKYDLNSSLLVPASMNIKAINKKKVGDQIKAYYFGDNKLGDSPKELSKFITDDQFIRPTLEMVRLISPVIPTYLYEFSYVGNSSIAPRNLPGVGHAEDVNYLWNTGEPLDEKDSVTSKKLVKLWTNFAKYRNPTPSKKLTLDQAIWKPSNSLNISFLQISTELFMAKNPRKKDMDFWSDLFNKYGNQPYDTY